MKQTVRSLLACLLLASLLAGCAPAAPQPAAPPVKETVIVEKPVEKVVTVKETVVVEKQAEVPAGVQEWELVNPAGVRQITALKMADRISTLEGKTVALKWNEKPGGDIFLDRVAELLAEQVKDVKIVKLYEVEPTTVPQTINADDAKRKAQLIAKYKPDIVIGSQCD